MKKFMGILTILMTGYYAQSQTDSTFIEFEKEFQEFSNSIEKELTTFEWQNDSLFIQFLEQSWKEFDIFSGNPPPQRPKPREQPSIGKHDDTIRQKIDFKGILKPDTIPKNNEGRLNKVRQPGYESRVIVKSFEVFGVPTKVQYYPDDLPQLGTQVNRKSIIKFYQDISLKAPIWESNLLGFKEIKDAFFFNDWGLYMIIEKAAQNIFSTKNEQTLFAWYALVKSGYQAKIGYSENNLYLLLPSYQELYNIQYLTENGLVYYIFLGGQEKPTQINTYPGVYTDDSKTFSFALNKLPELPNGGLKYRNLTYNRATIQLVFNTRNIEFLESHPQCELKSYFAVPISQANLDSLDTIFSPLLERKTNRERIDILLNFVQTSLEYQTDQEQFGKERYMFAEECLYYDYSDCEDRAVLLGQLIKKFTGLPAIGLEFNQHVTLAVLSPDEDYGYYILYKGNKYIICDPTFIHGKAGMVPEDLKKEVPRIILF